MTKKQCRLTNDGLNKIKEILKQDVNYTTSDDKKILKHPVEEISWENSPAIYSAININKLCKIGKEEGEDYTIDDDTIKDIFIPPSNKGLHEGSIKTFFKLIIKVTLDNLNSEKNSLKQKSKFSEIKNIEKQINKIGKIKTQIYSKNKRHNYWECPDCEESNLKRANINQPNYYVERGSIEQNCYNALQSKNSELIRIKAPKMWGKSYLLKHLSRYNKEELKCDSIYIDIKVFVDQSLLTDDVSNFVKDICQFICESLDISISMERFWKKDESMTLNLVRFFEDKLIPRLDKPLCLILDEIDWLFHNVADTFLYAIRYVWTRAITKREQWSNLKLFMAYNTDIPNPQNSIILDYGTSLYLPPFQTQEIQELAKRYSEITEFNEHQVAAVYKLVGGNPYLVKTTLNLISEYNPENNKPQSPIKFEGEGENTKIKLGGELYREGAFREHLDERWSYLIKDPDFAQYNESNSQVCRCC